MEGEWLERLGYLTTEFQRLHRGIDNAMSELLYECNSTQRRTRRGCLIEFSFPYYMRKRENAEEHDRIKATTIFNTD